MTREEVLLELEALGNERIKKRYIGMGAREPLFGAATTAMKPLFKRIKLNQPLAEELYATGNYDAMYFAGMIADPKGMTAADFDRWMESAYFPMLSDYVVAVTLAEADCAVETALRWIDSGRELYMSGGWACFEWLLGWRKDDFFDKGCVKALLDKAAANAAAAPERVRYAMDGFVAAVGVSYLPLHGEALEIAERVGEPFASARKTILAAKEKGKLGFKRKAVRC